MPIDYTFRGLTRCKFPINGNVGGPGGKPAGLLPTLATFTRSSRTATAGARPRRYIENIVMVAVMVTLIFELLSVVVLFSTVLCADLFSSGVGPPLFS